MTKEALELTLELSREFGDTSEVRRLAELVSRHSKTHKRIQEDHCNGQPSHGKHCDNGDYQGNYSDEPCAKEAAIEARIKALCLPFGIVPVFQADPRGCTVKLRVPSGRTNDWGKEGICVPSS